MLDTRTSAAREIEAGVGGIRRITFSPDGDTAVLVHKSTADGVKNIKYFVKGLSLGEEKITATYPICGGPLAFTPEGKPVPGVIVERGHLAFTPDGATLAVATNDGKIVFIDLAKGTVSEPLKAGTSLGKDRRKNIADIRFTKDGTRLVVKLGVLDHTLTMWDWQLGKPVTNEPIPDLDARPDSLLSPDGRYRIRRSESGTIEVIDLQANRPEIVSQHRVP